MNIKSLFLAAATLAFLTASSSADVITDFSNFAESGNMLNSGSHDREQSFSTSGAAITVAHESRSTGSAGQEIFGSDEFASFLTNGYRLSVEIDAYDFNSNTERIGLMTSSTIPAGGPASGDVRAAGDYFYWVYRAGNVQAGMFTSGGIEEEGGLVDVGAIGTDVTGLYMERNGSVWDLGYIDENGDDVFVQSRSTINGENITTDGSYIGLYSDMRDDATVFQLNRLSYGAVPEPAAAGVLGLVSLALVARRLRG